MSCALCPALCETRTQIVAPTPCRAGGILAIGEAPGADEDRVGEGFAGRAGKTLDALMAVHGISRAEYGRANIVRCRPMDEAGDNRKPTREESGNCMPKLAEFLTQVKPKVIVCVGGTPTAAFMGPGALIARIDQANACGGVIDPIHAHPSLRKALEGLAVRVFPMPHTSPLAWNRKAPDGTPWATVGAAQLAKAVQILNGI